MQGAEIDCMWVANGSEALEFIEMDREKTCCQDFVNYVITDLSMPIMDGFEFSKQALAFVKKRNSLKKKQGDPDDWLRIFALTGH